MRYDVELTVSFIMGVFAVGACFLFTSVVILGAALCMF